MLHREKMKGKKELLKIHLNHQFVHFRFKIYIKQSFLKLFFDIKRLFKAVKIGLIQVKS